MLISSVILMNNIEISCITRRRYGIYDNPLYQIMKTNSVMNANVESLQKLRNTTIETR